MARAASPPHAGPAGGRRHGRSVLRHILHLARDFLRSDERWLACGLIAGVVLLTFLQTGVQVALNLWNRAFFNALENRDRPHFFGLMGVFVLLFAASMATAVCHLYARQTLQLRWRRWLVRHLQARWLHDARHYQINFLPQAADNPDQRISENTRWATAMAVDMSIGLLQAILTLASFVGILWTISGTLHLTLFGSDLAVPGYMVYAALFYALLGSGLTLWIGRPMVSINIRRNQAESDHRFALIRMRESSEGIALIRGERDEERGLSRAFDGVVAVMRELMRSERHLMWLTSAYGMVAGVVPVLVASPRYFAGAITLGVLMQISSAFGQVTGSLNWFVDNFPRLADWRSHVERVMDLEDTFDAADAMAAESVIEVEEGALPDGREVLEFHDLHVEHADGEVMIAAANVLIEAGEKVLIVGESGTGKSTLFRAIAGVWPWGSGRIRVPPREDAMFMPQRPYLPLGTLEQAVSYPAAAGHFPRPVIEAALTRCGLPHLAPRLDEEERWDRMLSLGEQQRLGFARVLLHRPRWVFMDEATAALDEQNQDAMLRLFREELASSSLLSIGHRPGLDRYHDRTLALVRAASGARITDRQRVAVGRLRAARRGPLVRFLRRHDGGAG